MPVDSRETLGHRVYPRLNPIPNQARFLHSDPNPNPNHHPASGPTPNQARFPQLRRAHETRREVSKYVRTK